MRIFEDAKLWVRNTVKQFKKEMVEMKRESNALKITDNDIVDVSGDHLPNGENVKIVYLGKDNKKDFTHYHFLFWKFIIGARLVVYLGWKLIIISSI